MYNVKRMRLANVQMDNLIILYNLNSYEIFVEANATLMIIKRTHFKIWEKF